MYNDLYSFLVDFERQGFAWDKASSYICSYLLLLWSVESMIIHQPLCLSYPELDVSISVSYIPPPGAELGPNEYRAASGPVTVTCTAVGSTDPVSYQWSSTCTNCPFQTENSMSVIRLAVRTGDIGNHTCTATSGLISGSKTISFDVVGKQDAINVHALVFPI